MTATPASSRALVYAVGPDGSTGPLLTAGTLLLPYLVVLHPTMADPALLELGSTVRAVPRGRYRFRVVTNPGGGSQVVVDAVGLAGGSDDDEGWVITALLDRPVEATPLRISGASELMAHLDGSRKALSTIDLKRPVPQAPTGFTAPAKRPPHDWPAATWPMGPVDGHIWWKTCPSWWPKSLPFPLPFAVASQLRMWCPFCIFCCR